MESAEYETTRKTKIFSAIKQQIDLNESTGLKANRGNSWTYLAAAIIAFLICAIPAINFLSRGFQDEFEIGHASIIEQTNTRQAPISIDLPDGSNVILERGAVLSYPAQFVAAQRDVILNGNAFFNVRRDTLRPFRVHIGNLTTQVLGTSFTINAQDQRQAIEVIVRTGKVSVYQGHEMGDHPDAVILTPNQKVDYVVEEKKLVQSIVEQPVVVTAASAEFQFENAPAYEVIQRLVELYQINIRVDNEAIKSCPITASFGKQDLYTRVEMICKALGATFSVTEKEIVVTGGTCE
jgi:ferric-dicitrate binding protein FerR (iron transport regulator)